MFAEAPTTPSVSVSSSNGCPKCGTTRKSGKRSCCARGGAWFKRCGNVGDSNFDHTWVEGMQACKTFESSQAMLSREGATTNPLNMRSSALQNPTQQHANTYHPGGASAAVHTDSAGYLSAVRLVTYVSILCIISRLQM